MYDLFEFEDLCSTANCFIASASTSQSSSESVSSPNALKLKPLLDSLKYLSLGPDESLPIIIASDLDQNRGDKLIAVLRENKKPYV